MYELSIVSDTPVSDLMDYSLYNLLLAISVSDSPYSPTHAESIRKKINDLVNTSHRKAKQEIGEMQLSGQIQTMLYDHVKTLKQQKKAKGSGNKPSLCSILDDEKKPGFIYQKH